VILIFDTSMLIKETVRQIGQGIFIPEFHPICKEFSPTYKVILIDTLTHLLTISKSNGINFSKAIESATLSTRKPTPGPFTNLGAPTAPSK
jgi:hypothetical protein